jgi:hypothetical protein
MCTQYMLLYLVHVLYYASMTIHLDIASAAGRRPCPAALLAVSGGLDAWGEGQVCLGRKSVG